MGASFIKRYSDTLVIAYFYGPDTYAARHAIEELAAQERARTRWVEREQLEANTIADIVGQQVGLLGRSLVVVKNPSALPKAHQEAIALFIETSPAAPGILWDQGNPDKRSRLWRAVKSQAHEFAIPAPDALVQWLLARAQELGGALERAAATALVARLGNDRWRLENELKRLLLIATTVDLALVEEEIAVGEQAEIFSLLDALARGERASVVRGIQTLLAAGHSEFYILSMLGYQFRTLLAVRVGLDGGHAPAVIAREGALHPYVVEKNASVAARLSYERWRDSLTRILATDFAIKQGKVEARTGLLMLVVTLVETLSSAPREKSPV